MNEIEDFVEDPNENSDLFDCEFTSVDAVVNQVTVFTGWENRATENGSVLLSLMARVITGLLSLLTARN